MTAPDPDDAERVTRRRLAVQQALAVAIVVAGVVALVAGGMGTVGTLFLVAAMVAAVLDLLRDGPALLGREPLPLRESERSRRASLAVLGLVVAAAIVAGAVTG